MKRLCDKCKNLAVWFYAPSKDDTGYYCEDHVPRGCSCMLNDDGTMSTDPEGREQPCVEYDYNEKGFRIEL